MTCAHTQTLFPRRLRGGFAVCAALLGWASSAPADVPVTQLHSVAAFSQAVNGRTPQRAFATAAGVYELDTALKGVRVWQRSDEGLELLLPKDGDAFVPYTATAIEASRPRPQRFIGVDPAGNGLQFKQPVGMDVHPDGDRFAVLSIGEFISQGLNQYSPSIQVYDFEESTDADGALSSVKISLADEFANAFYVATNGMTQVFDRIYSYPDVLVTTNFYSDGSISSIVTNRFVTYTSNLVYRTSFTNWVLVLQGLPDLETQTNIVSQTGLTEPLFIDESDTSLFIPGFEYTIVRNYDWYSVTTNYYSLTNYVWKYSVTTNASYLSSATDVAFLGDAGLVASITADDYQAVRSAFLVFGTDPAAPAKLFPVEGLDKAIKGIAVDKETGDIYAAVPDMAAVFRFRPPNATADGVGGTPDGWLGLDDRTPVFHDDFVAGVTNAPGSAFGRLSNPADVSVWYPDSDGPILLVADTANGRVHAFDPDSLTWTATNWLGRKVDCWPDGTPFDESIHMSVSMNDAGAVVTNFYRLETTAFPLFTVTSAASPPNNPRGVSGVDGEPVLAMADTSGHRVRVFDVDLANMESDEILALAVLWPSATEAWPGLSFRDLAVTNGSSGGSVVWWDASHAGAPAGASLVVQEHDTYEYELRFSVAPSRQDRTYTLSVAGGDGVVAPVQGTVEIPAGATEGVLTFTANDGIVETEEVVSWRDAFGNWAPESDAAYAVTSTVAATPVYTLSIASSGGWSTNATLAVANIDPVITNAVFSGYIVMTMSGPILFVQGMHVDARDWVEADEGLRYLWWASTNINWAVNNLDWAVTHNDWESGASSDWSEGPTFEAVRNTTASEITGTETSGPVTDTIELLVATGRDVVVPYGYDEDGVLSTTDRNNAPFLAVCTVLDKDGAAAIITFPTAPDTSGTADRWSYDDGTGGGGGDEPEAVYAARFTAISGNNVTFEVSLVSGTPRVSDTVTLESAPELSGPWTTLRKVAVGSKTFPATFTVNPAGNGNVRFYRVVHP